MTLLTVTGTPTEALKIEACLRKNLAKISPECKAVVGCGGDILTNCATVKPGNGALAACLQKNQLMLTASCKSFLVRIKD